MKRFLLGPAVILISAGVSGCAHFTPPNSAEAPALQGAQMQLNDTRCDGETAARPYTFSEMKDCTAPDSLIVFTFSGGGMRSASFGYGVLGAVHAVAVPDATGTHPLDRDIDIVAGVSGGSFTAAAFANQRDALFPSAGTPDHYRDNFLTHDFEGDLTNQRLEPWLWHGLLPMFASDEIATTYGEIEFSSPSDKLFAASFGDLAKKGRPFLLVQATDIANQQSVTFTQDDFDLICTDVGKYPVASAIAASSAVPVLFTPMKLTNHHGDAKPGEYCATHRPPWVDQSLGVPPADFSRHYARAMMAERYLPKPATGARPSSRQVLLQDGGIADNLALRGVQNILTQYLDQPGTGAAAWNDVDRETACRQGMDRVRRVLLVAVDGEGQIDPATAQAHSWSLGLIIDAIASTAMKANSFETLLTTDALTKRLAARLAALRCTRGAAPARGPALETAAARAAHNVTPYFAHISFDDLDPQSALPPAACRHRKARCTLGELARSETGLSASGAQVDALIAAGRSAFACNREITQFLKDSNLTISADPHLTCREAASP